MIDALDPAAAKVARHREATALLGMVVFVAAWAMLFAGLFFAYGVVRARAVSWPPADLPRLPLALPALATLVLGLGSAALQRALAAVRGGHAGTRPLLAAWALGATFLGLQAVTWARLWAAGLRPDGGPYPSSFYGLTVFHALHVIVGLVALAALLGRPRALLPLRLWTIYFHMVGVVWALMFLLVYVV